MSIRNTSNFYRNLRRLSRAPRCWRAFFTLPDLSSLSPFSDHEPQTYHERKIFPYQAQQLYNVVADVASYPSFLPFCTGSRIISKTRHGNSSSSPESMDAELTVGFLSLKESYVSRVTCKPFASVEAVASSSTPLFKTLSTTWRFQPASPNSPHASAGHIPFPKNLPAFERPATSVGDTSTLVTLDLAFAFSNPVHATVSAAFFGQVSKLMVKAFEERCMKVYGPGNK
ncbi:hypothetical protein PILCRDRAFT_58648 [Piloderma croceum F 1598]|uniref:Coenzyme Q-binding protein COQ10 START domain-containing protein n=1 Tax=Piloderma croceum (strain F 1598) TaxID=765440 RepID=A0A0C3G3A2_PILCF|nr:hypothetical protein PILCRDRAFT_58648 [Piloderma croceum F 1598]